MNESKVSAEHSIVLGNVNCGEGMKFSDRKSVCLFYVFSVLSIEDRSPKTSRRKSKVLSAKYSSRCASISLVGDVEKCQYWISCGPTDSRGATIQNTLKKRLVIAITGINLLFVTNAKYFRSSHCLTLYMSH